MNRTDQAAHALAEATRARYTQPNGTLVVPVLMRRFNRRFWDAMETYDRSRTETP